jgi:hypothetical protein
MAGGSVAVVSIKFNGSGILKPICYHHAFWQQFE